jgi:hypothetical protein
VEGVVELPQPDNQAVRELEQEVVSLVVVVPIIHPCWSGSVPVLVEGAAEPVSFADIQLRDPLRMGKKPTWCRQNQSIATPADDLSHLAG